VATSTVEDYLKQILLEEQRAPGALVSTGHVAASLNVAPGTATSMIKTLAEAGLLRYEPYGGVNLTSSGRQLATRVLRRHRLLELFLVRVLGMDWSEVHAEAERLEHAVSDRLLERIDEMLGHPAVDPHGDPIPSAEGVVEEPELASLLTCPLATRVVVSRIGDQSAGFLRWIEHRGLTPGSRLEVLSREEAADAVELRPEGAESLSLGFRAASKILVVET
jgi:DtxR family Mn-dependent transcriptional regulator